MAGHAASAIRSSLPAMHFRLPQRLITRLANASCAGREPTLGLQNKHLRIPFLNRNISVPLLLGEHSVSAYRYK